MVNTDFISKLKELIENDGKVCSVDLRFITPIYVLRMCGGSVEIEEGEKGIIESLVLI